jgi:hypothetical protein
VKVDWTTGCELVYEFEVSRRILIKVPFFMRLVTPEVREGGQQLTEQEVIELKHDNPKAWKTWLHAHLMNHATRNTLDVNHSTRCRRIRLHLQKASRDVEPRQL